MRLSVCVTDTTDEAAYMPPLRDAGYELRIREPEFFEHRMLRTANRDVHLHVFGPDAAEADRALAFRDTLRTDSSARQRYERVKRRLARREWPTMQQYADAKSNTIDDILCNSGAVPNPVVCGGQKQDRGHCRAAQGVQPQVDLHAQVAEPDIELALPTTNGTTATSPTMPDTSAAVSHHEYCLYTAHAAIVKPITAAKQRR